MISSDGITRQSMVIWVVTFPREGYEIRSNLPKIQNTQRKISCQKVQKYDFEEQFSMSKYGHNPSKQKIP